MQLLGLDVKNLLLAIIVSGFEDNIGSVQLLGLDLKQDRSLQLLGLDLKAKSTPGNYYVWIWNQTRFLAIIGSGFEDTVDSSQVLGLDPKTNSTPNNYWL